MIERSTVSCAQPGTGASASSCCTSCLTAAKEAWELSGGAFDPTVGPLVDLWRQAAARGTVPTDEEIEKARAQVGMDKIEMLVAKVQKPAEELPLVAPGAPPPTD